jgi:hypothetical protein
MGIFEGSLFRWLGKPASKPAGAARPKTSRSAANSTQFVQSHSGPTSTSSASSQHAVRKDLLKVVLRETLMRNGIPASWIGADLLRSTSPKRGEPGIHVRLLVRHWDSRLMQCSVAFEQNFYRRLVAMDPLATNWLMGISWQYAMDDLSECPPLPHPGSWTAQPTPTEAAVAARSGPATSGGDIIEGPVVISPPQDDVRADLEKLLAVRDEDLKRKGTDPFASTQPISL